MIARLLRPVIVAFAVACHTPRATTDASPAPPEPAQVDADASDPSDALDASDASDARDANDADEASAPTDMLRVPAGSFTMGADRGGEEDEHPAHTVMLEGFWLDRTPVTNEAYARCVSAKACATPDAHDPKYLLPQHPIIGVTWDEAKAYCAWSGKRLPTEAEYERAMRDDDGRTYAWGNDPPTPERAAFGRSLEAGSPDDVATHPSGRGPFGHDDLAGEVWEWCDDFYDPYAYRRKTADRGVPGTCADILATQDTLRDHGQQGFTGSNPIPHICERVLRGGAFNYDAPGLRATNRVHHPGHYKLVMAGFRCARTE